MKNLRLFFFGIIAAFSAFFLELILVASLGNAQETLRTFFFQITPLLFIAVITEELFKFVFIYKEYSNLQSDLKETVDSPAIVKKMFFSSIYIGLGFSFIEILVTSFGLSLDLSFSQLALPILGILLVHVITSATMGYLLAKSKSFGFAIIFKILAITTALHFLYNLLVIYSVSPLYVSVYLLLLISFFLIMFSKITQRKTV